MKCINICKAKILFGCLNAVLSVCGILKVLCGFLLLCDSKRVLLSKLLADPESNLSQPPFYYVALALLMLGLTVCTTSALGCWATYMPGYTILTAYFLVVLSLLVGECASGVLATLWPRCAGVQAVRGGAAGALQAYYGVPNYEAFTTAIDLAQTEFQCCGMSDARNYDMSLWQLRRLGPRGLAVPLSCCVQDENTPSYLNPQPVNESRCQEIKPNAQYRHVEGCLEYVEDWYHQQYIIFMMTLFVLSIFKFTLLLSTVFSCIWIRKHRRVISKIMGRSHDNKTNENIYRTNMFSLQDEPITAKYVQPNNFYSPRIRNPHIFHNKSNEVI